MGYTCTARKLSRQLSKLFNTKVVIYPNEIEEAYALTAGSAEATELVIPYLNYVLNTHNLKNNCHVEEGPCKRLTRMFAKKIEKGLKNISDIPDVGRVRLLVTDYRDIQNIRKAFLGNDPLYNDKRIGNVIDTHPTNQIEIKEFEDFYHVPSSTGRVAIHLTLNVKISGKAVVPYEVQIMLDEMVNTEDVTRDNYINKQTIVRQAKDEDRPLTPEENMIVQNYNDSSRKRYNADIGRYCLASLLRPDLAQQYYNQQKASKLLPTTTPDLKLVS